MFKYKLSIVEERHEKLAGAKNDIVTYKEIVTIGYFITERALRKWAEDNLGEIDKE